MDLSPCTTTIVQRAVADLGVKRETPFVHRLSLEFDLARNAHLRQPWRGADPNAFSQIATTGETVKAAQWRFRQDILASQWGVGRNGGAHGISRVRSAPKVTMRTRRRP